MTKRNNGKGYEWLKKNLTFYVRGWLNYYRLADMKQFIGKTSSWLNRHIRAYIWKSWKRIRTKFANLQKCGIGKWSAWQWANTRKGYWRIADSWILHRAISNENLHKAGYPNLVVMYDKVHRN